MAEEIEYLGTVQTADGRTPLLVRANDQETRERVRRESSGDVIFTNAKDMPSLEELLKAHGVLYAVLESEPPSHESEVVSLARSQADWKVVAGAQLDANLAAAVVDGVMDEEFAFIAALGPDALDSFVDRADALLQDDGTDEEAWGLFLQRVATDADTEMGHTPLLKSEASDGFTQEREPLLSIEDLGVAFTGGAMGGARPLASSGAI